MIFASTCFGALGDITVISVDGGKAIWHSNSQTFSIAGLSSMSDSSDYLWPAAKGTAGQALIIDSINGSEVTFGFGTPSSAAAHAILGPTHNDSTTQTVTRGSIIFGNSTPLWDELVKGANQEVLVSNATDVLWGTVDISGGTNLAVDTDHLKLTGDTLSFSDTEKTVSHSRQGSFLEQIDFTVSEAGGTVTGSLEKEGGGDLTQFWSDDFDVLDCTGPVCTVNLTAFVGTDTSPAAAFVYILQSAKTTLVANTSFPANSVEHIRVCSLVLQSAATTGTNGALMVRNWNDPAFGITNPRGGAIISNERLRKEHALYDSGIVLTVTGSGTATVTLDTSAGFVYQLNLQAFPAIDMAGADDIHLVNLSGSEYSTTSNLVAGITTLADGVTALANNKYFNLVIWGVQNRTGTDSHLLCNLPTGQYGKQGDATIDAEKFSVHTIPSDFRGTGFLIAELTFQFTSGPVWTLIQNRDLLGQPPILIPGGGTTNNISTFLDSVFEVFDNGDDTKRMNFQLSGITTGNTRTITMADDNLNLDILDVTTAGTVDASRVLLVDSNKDIGTIRNLTIDGTFTDGTMSISGGDLSSVGTVTATTVVGGQITMQGTGFTSGSNMVITPLAELTINGTLQLGANTLAGTSVNINNAELQQLSNIAATTISAGQWSFLGTMDQAVATSDNVTFGTIGCDTITLTANSDVVASGTGHITSGSEGFIVGTLTITDGSIDDTDGSIAFGATNFTGVGTLGSGAITSTAAVGGTDLTASDDIIGQDDLQLDSDGALIQLGEDQDVVITHVADTGILLALDRQIQFGDSATFIESDDDGYIDIDADTGIRLNSATNSSGQLTTSVNDSVPFSVSSTTNPSIRVKRPTVGAYAIASFGGSTNIFYETGTTFDSYTTALATLEGATPATAGTLRFRVSALGDVFVQNDLSVSGDADFDQAVQIDGKLTVDGGTDPPYVLYNLETRQSIIDRVKAEVPASKQGGAAMFFNQDTHKMETYVPSKGKFYDVLGKLLYTMPAPDVVLEERTRSWFLDSVTGEIKPHLSVIAKKYKVKEGYELDGPTGRIFAVSTGLDENGNFTTVKGSEETDTKKWREYVISDPNS